MNQLLLRSGGWEGGRVGYKIGEREGRGETSEEGGREGVAIGARTDGGEAARALLNQLLVLDSGAGE